jgi:enoyl-CoA hydratase
MLTGEPISAEEAKRIGLVNEVVSSGELLATAERLAKATMRAAPSSIRVIKKLMSQQFDPQKLMQSVEELIGIVQTEEGKEGHRAFVEKRPPKWVEI